MKPVERIAVVSHSHPSISKGGGEIAAYSLFRGLLEIGRDAIFIGACPENDQAKVSFQTDREFIVYHKPEIYEHFYHTSDLRVVDDFHRIIEQQNITLINYHHFFNFGLSSLGWPPGRNKPTSILTIHEFLAICHHHGQMVTRSNFSLCAGSSPTACAACYPEHTPQQFALRKANFLEAFRSCDGFISPSNFLARRFVDWGLSQDDVAVIENGLLVVPDKRDVRPTDEGERTWVVGFFGQINPFKGVDILLQAAQALRLEGDQQIEIRLHGNLVGVGDDFVTRFHEELKTNTMLTWLGPYDNRSVASLMAQCDYVIVPSRWWENSPVVIQEAFAVGRPVISTGIGGMAEKVSNGVDGLHFRLNDKRDLINVLKRACDPSLHHKLVNNTPKALTSVEMAQRYCEYFEKVVGRSTSL